LADKIVDCGMGSLAAEYAVVQGDLEQIEMREVRANPVVDVPPIADADGRMRRSMPSLWPASRLDPGATWNLRHLPRRWGGHRRIDIEQCWYSGKSSRPPPQGQLQAARLSGAAAVRLATRATTTARIGSRSIWLVRYLDRADQLRLSRLLRYLFHHLQ
jgi:hypothetical protein